MAFATSMKLGSKSNVFQNIDKTWCTTGLPSDIAIDVGDVTFHLHKFPLLSRSQKLEKLIKELSMTRDDDDRSDVDRECSLEIHALPGGAKSFELVSKFCYDEKFELNPSNIVAVRCAAEYLQMTEDYGEHNLIYHSENFLQQLLKDWNVSLQVLKSCEEDSCRIPCEQLEIVDRCIVSVAIKVISRENVQTNGGLSSGGTWNGIDSQMEPSHQKEYHDWWYEDISNLSLDYYKRFIVRVTQRGGMSPKSIAGSLMFYLKRHLPTDIHKSSWSRSRKLVENIVWLIPLYKDVISTENLLHLLNTSMKLRTEENCLEVLEKMVGAQLEHAEVNDLLITNDGYCPCKGEYDFDNLLTRFAEPLYNVEVVKRIVDHFLAFQHSSELMLLQMSPPCSGPLGKVAKIMDWYLAEVALDEKLNFDIFFSLAATIPDHARPIHDNLYHAIDNFFQTHQHLSDSEREKLCRLLNCKKLSVEACTHGAQNERLPLRMITQLLYFEQLRLSSSIQSWILNKPSSSTSLRTSHLTQSAHPNGSKGVQHGSTSIDNEIDKKVKTPEREITLVKKMMVKETDKPCSWSMLPNKFRLLTVKPLRPFCSSRKDDLVNCQSTDNRDR